MKELKQLLTTSVRARFSFTKINDMWSEFYRQVTEDPGETYFRVGEHTQLWQGVPYTQEVLVKIDEHPDGKVATMLLSGEF